jgi:hypothetical protein
MADRWLLTITAPFTSPACSERVRLARSFVRVFLEEALLVHPREFKSVPAFYLPGLAWPTAVPARLSARPFLAARAGKRGVARTLAMSHRAFRYEN